MNIKEEIIKIIDKQTEPIDPSKPSYTSIMVDQILDLILSKIVIKKEGKHDGKCDHDNNWCITHAEELLDDEYTEYGFNSCIDQLEEIKNKLRK